MCQEVADLLNLPLTSLSAQSVHQMQFLRFHLHAADLKRFLRRYDERIAFLSLADHIFHLRVIHLMSALHTLVDGRIFAQYGLDEPAAAQRCLAIVERTGQDDDITVIAEALEVLERDGVGHTAIEQELAIERHWLAGHRQGSRCTDPFEHLIVDVVNLVIDRLSGSTVGADEVELHRVLGKGLSVEDIDLCRDDVVAELCIDIVARLDEGAYAHVLRIAHHLEVIAQGSSWLVGLHVDAEACTSRDADDAIEAYQPLGHHLVDDTRGKDAAESASFKY